LLSACGFFGCGLICAFFFETWCDYWNDFLMSFEGSLLQLPVFMVLVAPVFFLSISGAIAAHCGALYVVTGLMAGLIGRIVKKLKRTNQSEGMQK
jgi:hypothetical protein